MLSIAAMLTALTACGGPADDTASALLGIVPAAPEIAPGESLRFAAEPEQPVEWAVLEPDGGVIDADGVYTAPEAEGTYTIAAWSSRGEKTTQVHVKRNVRVDVVPSTAALAPGESIAFSAAVTGKVKTVTWSVEEGAAGGVVTADGVYTAPDEPGTYHVVATSVADPSRSDRAIVNVAWGDSAPEPTPEPAPTQKPVIASFTATPATIAEGASATLAWTVDGETALTISGVGSVTGRSSVTVKPAATTTYTLTATNAAGSVTATTTVTVTAPQPLPTGPQFYVATNGNDANPGTFEQPWRTIQKAMNSATPGSTVNIRGGTYRERLKLNVQGSAGKVITFQPYGFSVPAGGCGGYTGVRCGGEEVIIDLAHLGTDTSFTPVLHISSKSYVRIQGLVIQNYTCSGPMKYVVRIDGTSSFIDFRHNILRYHRNIAPWDGSSALSVFRIHGPARDVTVYGNEFHDVQTNYGETLTIGAYGGSAVANAVVERNYIHHTDGIGIDIQVQSYNWVIRANRLDWISKKADGSWWYGNPANAIYNDGGNTGVIEGNYVTNAGMAFVSLAEPGQPAVYDVTIRNNVATHCMHGIVLGTWYSTTDGSSVRDHKVYNNTFYRNDHGVVIRPMVASTVTWRNNIFANNGLNYVNTGGWNPGVPSHNLYFGGSAGPDATRYTADPMFVNAAAGDFRLRAGSPAVNAGDPATTTALAGTVDRAGAPRIQGGRIDLGAHELQ